MPKVLFVIFFAQYLMYVLCTIMLAQAVRMSDLHHVMNLFHICPRRDARKCDGRAEGRRIEAHDYAHCCCTWGTVGFVACMQHWVPQTDLLRFRREWWCNCIIGVSGCHRSVVYSLCVSQPGIHDCGLSTLPALWNRCYGFVWSLMQYCSFL